MRSRRLLIPVAAALLAGALISAGAAVSDEGGGAAGARPTVDAAAAAGVTQPPRGERSAPAQARSEPDPPSAGYPLPAPPVDPRPCRPVSGGGGEQPERPAAKVRTRDLPDPLPVRPRKVDLDPVTGKGMWLTTWADTDPAEVARVIAKAQDAGLRQIWVRTGGTRQGWYGTALLERVLPAAHAAGIAVVAWDFPFLSDPMADVARARQAIEGTFAGHRIDAFSPDIETANEGTFTQKKRVKLYLSHVRGATGTMPVISTVMRPTPDQLESYPYRAQVPYIDAFAPMVYWSCNEPGKLARESVRALSKWRPVHLVGQSYDMGPQGGPRGVPPKREIWRFLDVAHRADALGASLYNSDGAGRPQWKALARYPWKDRG